MQRIVFFLLFFASLFVQAQSGKRITRPEYIERFNKIAMEEMKRTGIPASITLAQGCLESGDGNSRLALKANNHFGIKCHDWKGATIKEDDDARNECFRKYKSADDSYHDHSEFLTTKSRYAELFELKPDDYKGWAKGLKKAGYATSPTYATALIKIIEDFELYKYDQQVLGSSKISGRHAQIESEVTTVGSRKILYNNRIKYIVADSNDTYSRISDELDLFSWQLPRYNEVSINSKPKKGDYIYLQPKRNVNFTAPKTHIVKTGETLHSIAQYYGLKESKLRDRNNLPEDSEPNVGSTILLRGRIKAGVDIPSYSIEKSPKDSTNDEESEFQIEFE